MIAWIILIPGVALLIFFIVRGIQSKNKPAEILKVYPEIHIPHGEFLHYGNYFEGKKYADFYVVTEQEKDGEGDTLYRSYIDVIALSENRKPARDYKTWPSFSLYDGKHGSTMESLAVLNTTALHNWREYQNLKGWKMRLNQENGEKIYEYTTFFGDNDHRIEKHGRIKSNPRHASFDMWGTFFVAARFFDFSQDAVMDTINPVYYTTSPSSYIYHKETRENFQTKAGTFSVKRFVGDPSHIFNLKPSRMLEDFNFVRKNLDILGQIAKEPFAIYVEDSERRVMVKMHTIVGAGDYILEKIANVNTDKGFLD